jgi:hypothetical protein
MVAEERWHGLLWSAVPQIVVSSTSAQLVTYLPAGTVSVLASNRGMPGTEGLSREERKLRALETLRARAVEHVESPHKLYLYRSDRWARINLGWDPDTGAFLGWYVNFELPGRPTPCGLVSKDLVLDLWVDPDRTWHWKDQEEYAHAIDDGILDPSIREPIDSEGIRILEELESDVGPFADPWNAFEPDASWSTPQLPAAYRWKGNEWAIPAG